MTVLESTRASVDAASHLTSMDDGAVAAVLVLAAKIDAIADENVVSLDDLKGKFDNVTIPTYLKFCESLGLTPAGRKRLDEKKDAAGGKLAQLRSANKRSA